MGTRYQLNPDGSSIDAEHRARYKAYNAKPAKLSKANEDLVPATKSHRGKYPSFAAGAATTEGEQILDQPSSPRCSDAHITENETGPESEAEGRPTEDTKGVVEMPSSVAQDQPSAGPVVHISRDHGAEELGMIRKPTRPAKPNCSLKRLREEVSVPTPAPKVERPMTKTRRFLEMRPSSLVAAVQKSHGKRSSQVVDELTAKYDLRPTDMRAKINEMRVARQARRAFATEIRRHFRLDAGEEEGRQFLTWLEEECKNAEGALVLQEAKDAK